MAIETASRALCSSANDKPLGQMIAHEINHRHARYQRKYSHCHYQSHVGSKSEQGIDGHGDRFAPRHGENTGKNHFHPGKDKTEKRCDPDTRRDDRNQLGNKKPRQVVAVKKGGFIELPWDG